MKQAGKKFFAFVLSFAMMAGMILQGNFVLAAESRTGSDDITEGTPAAIASTVTNLATEGYTVNLAKSKATYNFGKDVTLQASDIRVMPKGVTAVNQQLNQAYYTVSYQNNRNVGTATITVTGNEKFGYTGSISTTFTVEPISLKNASASDITVYLDGQSATTASLPYTKSQVKPVVKVEMKTGTGSEKYVLQEGIDYTCTFYNNSKIGARTDLAAPYVSISGKGNFAGTASTNRNREVKFTIVAADIAKQKVSVSPASYVYDGTEKKPTVTVTDAVTGKALTLNTDYTVSYKNNKNVGTATVTVTGQGNYKGSATATFSILSSGTKLIDIGSSNPTVSIASCTYSGTAQEPKVNLTVAGKALTAGKDFNTTYMNNINAGTGTVTITGINSYTGSIQTTFTIKPKQISDSTVTAEAKDAIYTNGTRPATTVTIRDTKRNVVLTTNDYTLSYASGQTYNVGDTVKITVTGKNNYQGSRTVTYKILADPSVPTKLKTPVVNTPSNVNGGIQITWGAVTGAEKYRVFYKTGSGSWTKLADTTSTSYTWKKAASGTTYAFTVRCISSDGGSNTSDYDTTGKSITYIAAPKLSGVSNVNGGVKITWGAVTGAAKYRVFYKTGSGSWTKLADTTATNYTWKGAASGTAYAFTVRCISSDGKATTSAYDETGKSITYIAAPKLSGVSNVNGGVKITWGAVTGAAKYRVFYKTGSGSWTKLADTTSTSYTWKGAASGTAYAFTVRCISSDGGSNTSDYDTTGKSITYIAAPKLSGVSNVNGGVKITWGAVTGAAKYRVFYKTGSGSWTKLADTTATNYTWKGAASGTAYAFTVRCISSDGGSNTSDYDTTGKSITYIAAPKLSGVSNVNGGVKITWGAVTGAAKYRVFYKTGSGSWTKLADTTSTNYTWKKAASGTTYAFTVRCISSDGKTTTSAYDETGKSITYIAAPKLSEVSNVKGGVKLSWDTVKGAAKYRVLYKTGSGSWTKLADTTSTNYTWKGAADGTAYTFTVRCISSDGKSYTSAYDETGKKITYHVVNDLLASPSISTVKNVSNGVQISWGAVTGAAKYRVFYRTDNGGWQTLADTTSTSYTWTKAASGKIYAFTVRCISSDGKNYTSNYDTTGKTLRYLSCPAVSVANAAGGVKISWTKSAGTNGYNVYRKPASGGSWSTIAVIRDQNTLTYTDAKASSGISYVYTVKAFNGSYASAYDTAGKTIRFLSCPTVSVANAVDGVKISWTKSKGTNGYNVYRKPASGGSWSTIAVIRDQNTLTYTDKTATSGKSYIYTVKAFSGSYASAYDKAGKTIKYLAYPMVSVANTTGGIKISWTKSGGTSGYNVYRKPASGGSWTTIAVIRDQNTLTYTDKNVKKGTSYIYTVKAFSGSYASIYNKGGKQITYSGK